MYLVDYHMHSRHSSDGDKDPSYTMEAMCEAALNAGLSEIAVTDHYDVNPLPEGIDFPPTVMSDVYADVMGVRESYKGRLKVLFGIELGQPTQNEPLALKLLDEYKYDFIIGSLHNVENEPDYYFIDYQKTSKNKLISLWERYLEETLTHIEWGKGRFHTLAHFGYLVRYYKRNGLGDLISFADKTDIITEIFKKVIDCNMALEINTSGIRQGLDECIPTDFCLRMYRDLGGEMFTIGSDAHYACHIGDAIKDGYERIKALGIDYIMISESGELIKKKF